MQTPTARFTWLVGLSFLAVLALIVFVLQNVIAPFLAAAVLAYILNPLVERLTRRRLGRSSASLLVMLATCIVLIVLLLITIPVFIEQVSKIAERLPNLVRLIQAQWLPVLNDYLPVHLELDAAAAVLWIREHVGSLQVALSGAAGALLRRSGSILLWLGNLLLLPFLLYYFLLDWPHITEGSAKLIPRRFLAFYLRVRNNMDRILSEFLRGQVTVMFIMAAFYGFGLWLVNLEAGFAIGVVAGLLVFVPYLGAFTGLLLATLAALLQFGGGYGLLAVWGVFALGQLLESFVITPKIVGERIGLSPFWIIFALAAFGSLFGFVGMLLALPLAAIVLVLVREGMLFYYQSDYYLALDPSINPSQSQPSNQTVDQPREP